MMTFLLPWVANREMRPQSPPMLRNMTTLLAVLALASSAAASSTSWTESEGGSIRIVTTGLSDENGELRGALEIKLKPGWKTYWRNPGESGVPPLINLSEQSDATGSELFFPPPERFTDPYATWAGYKDSVSLPIIFKLPGPEMAGIVEGSVFLGICDTICIPVEAPFSFDAGADPDNSGDAIAVTEAFATLPGKARQGFQVNSVKREGTRLRFKVELPEDTGEAALFVAPREGVQIDMPELQGRQGAEASFSAEILSEEAMRNADLTLEYTLVAGEEAVDGQIALP